MDGLIWFPALESGNDCKTGWMNGWMISNFRIGKTTDVKLDWIDGWFLTSESRTAIASLKYMEIGNMIESLKFQIRKFSSKKYSYFSIIPYFLFVASIWQLPHLLIVFWRDFTIQVSYLGAADTPESGWLMVRNIKKLGEFRQKNWVTK